MTCFESAWRNQDIQKENCGAAMYAQLSAMFKTFHILNAASRKKSQQFYRLGEWESKRP